jgi:hypothetical protein
MMQRRKSTESAHTYETPKQRHLAARIKTRNPTEIRDVRGQQPVDQMVQRLNEVREAKGATLFALVEHINANAVYVRAIVRQALEVFNVVGRAA